MLSPDQREGILEVTKVVTGVLVEFFVGFFAFLVKMETSVVAK